MENALATPDQMSQIDAMALTLIDQAKKADSTKLQYRRALAPYLDQGGSLGNPEALAEYARGLGESRRRMLKSALALVGDRLGKQVKAQVTPGNLAQVQATVMRLEALPELVETTAPKGQKVHFWLSARQVQALMATCTDDLTGQRDRVVLGILTGAGLRRDEMVNLEWAAVEYRPTGDRMRCVLNVTGKGAKRRTIPISDSRAALLDRWQNVTGDTGRIARSLGMAQELGDAISGVGILDIVRKHGAAIGLPDLAPHDLRRTYAEFARQAGFPIEDISILLGHANIQTTIRYLDLKLDLDSTPSDFVPL